jgi:hypothetical protein
MARNTEGLAVTGSIGDVTYYKSKNGKFARKKAVVNKNNFTTNPKMAKVRAHAVDFGHAIKAGNLIRVAFRNMLKDAKQFNTSSRLTGVLFRVVKGDITHPRGQRLVSAGDLTLLSEYEFNETLKVSKSIYSTINTSVDRVTGRVNVEIPDIVPKRALNAPANATHFRITLGAAVLDFASLKQTYAEASTQELPISNEQIDDIALTAMLPANSTGIIMVVLGLEFFETEGTQRTLITPSGMQIREISKP